MATFPLWAQYLLIGAAIAASVMHVMASRFPKLTQRCRAWIVTRLVDSQVAPLRRLGLRLAPVATPVGACGACSGCEPR